MISKIAIRVSLAAALVGFLGTPSHAADVNWAKYMTLAANASAIASALALVDGCSKPLVVTETKEGDSLRLQFDCKASEDEEASSIVVFDVFGDTVLPSRFEFAG